VSDPGTFDVLRPARPGLPVVVHAPHGSTHIPADVRADLLLDDETLTTELLRMTDHHTDRLAEHLVGTLGVTAFVNRTSRLVVDPERFPDPADEDMDAAGMGAVYTRTHDGRPLRTEDADRRAALLADYFHPYADALTGLVAATLEAHGSCLLVDLHSYPSQRLPYERGGSDRPAVCIGTHPVHTPSDVVDAVTAAADDHGLDTALDTPFAGTYVPLQYFGRDDAVRSVMLELRRDTYLDEATAEPADGYANVQRFLVDAVSAAAGIGPA
jgi:N-formylglutamate deformylase